MLYLITAPVGMHVAWCLASPQLGEREVAAHAARTSALRPELTLIGDKGFAGCDFENLLASGFGLRLVRPGRRDEKFRHGRVGWIGQGIEPVNDPLKGQFDLERHGGRTTAGIYTRIAQRPLDMAATSWHNWTTAEPVKRSLIAYNHRTHKGITRLASG